MKNYIIDFDSTFIKVESLDELLEISEPGNKLKIDKVKNITNEGMEGKISFSESLSRRIKLLEATKDNIDKTVQKLRDKVSDSFVNNIDCLLYTSPSPRDS